MPGLLSQIDQAVGGVDLAQLGGATGAQYGALAQAIGAWSRGGPPGAFGAALGSFGALNAPALPLAGSLGGSFAGLLPALQGAGGGGGLSALVGTLQSDVGALPERLQQQLLGAVQPLIGRVETLRTLLGSDWSCGLVPGLGTGAAAPAPAPSPAPSPAPAPGPAPAPAPAPGGTLNPAQVDAARALIDRLPAGLNVPDLLRWLHARVGSFRPGYFTLRSLPLLDEVRDPLDTLLRWEAASAAEVEAELQQTLAALTALVQAQSGGLLARALPGAQVAALPAAALSAASESYIVALEALAVAVQTTAADLPARFAAAQSARTGLLAANATLAAAEPSRAGLEAGLAALPGELDAGLARLMLLLQPRAGLAGLTAALGPLDATPLPPEAFAPVQQLFEQLQQQLEALLDTLDVSAAAAPLTEALDGANAAVQAVEQGLAQLGAQALQMLAEARTAVEAIDLDALRQQAEAQLQAVTAQLADTVGSVLGGASGALGEALTVVFEAMDEIDPEALAAPVREAIQALGELLEQEAIQRLAEVIDQLEELAGLVTTLSFEPVADQVIAAIDELQALLAGIDPADLPAPGPELISGALALLPPSLIPLTDPLIAELDAQVAASPTAALEQVKALPGLARERLLAFSPRAALSPLLAAPFREALAGLEGFDPLRWLTAADAALAQLRGRLAAQLDIAAALAEAARAHARLLAELERLRPSTLLAPLEATIEQALAALAGALPVDDLAAALGGVLGRVRGFTGDVDAAMDVAEHLTAKLQSLGDADAEFLAWLDAILLKLPLTAAGPLAGAVEALRQAALAVRPAPLAAAWATARTPLAAALAGVQPAARLTRLTLARSRVQAGLGNPAVTAAAPALATWLIEPQSQAAGAGLNALAALERALAAADAALAAQFTRLGASFPHPDGALAPLLPAGPATLRAWVREAALQQFGTPVLGLLRQLKPLGALVATAVTALRALVAAIEARLDTLLAAPAALQALLGSVGQVQQRLASLDLGVYARAVDEVYLALLDELRALDPRSLRQPLEQARDRLLGLISLDGLLPPALRGQLTEARRQLLAKLGSLDPDALLLEPLDAEYRELVEPLVGALDIGETVQRIIDWLNDLPEDLQAQIARVDQSYAGLLRSAPGGGGAGAGLAL